MAAYLVPVDTGRPIVLDKAVVFIGRHPECDVILTRSRKVSRKHCCIAQVNNAYVVRDLGSMNGVRVNGKRIKQQAPLAIGDELTVADVRYTLQVQDAKNGQGTRANGKRSSAAPDRDRTAADLSREVPVPISEDDEEARSERPQPMEESSDHIPLVDDGRSEEAQAEDDVRPLEERAPGDSSEFEDSDSQVETPV